MLKNCLVNEHNFYNALWQGANSVNGPKLSCVFKPTGTTVFFIYLCTVVSCMSMYALLYNEEILPL